MVGKYGHWLVALGFYATSAAVISWLSHTSTNTTLFPKPPTTFLTCFSRGERRKYTGKKPPDHESDTLTTEPPGRGTDTGITTVSHNAFKTALLSKGRKISGLLGQ